jgi:hypothetical protein
VYPLRAALSATRSGERTRRICFRREARPVVDAVDDFRQEPLQIAEPQPLDHLVRIGARAEIAE